MSMDLEKKTFRYDPAHFVAGVSIGITTAVKAAGEDLAAHAPVVLADGVLKAAAAPADGAELTGLYGITADSAKNGEDAVVCLTGEFFSDSLALPAGLTADTLEVPLRSIGIFLK